MDTYKLPSIQNVLYSDKYQSTEENNCLKRKEECFFPLAHTTFENGIVLCLKIFTFALQSP